MAAKFDLRQLRYFAAVAEAGSFRAAAEQLHVSQPPLSRQVAELEKVLGVRLFDRRASGVTLTSSGRTALAHARSILKQAVAFAGSFSNPALRRNAPIRIGIAAAVTVADRALLSRAWKKAIPGATLDISPGFSRDLIPALKSGHLDFAIVGLPGDTTGLEIRDVDRSILVSALPAKHRLARRKRISLLEMTDLPLFWIPRSHNPAYHDFCMRYFRRIGYHPEMITVEPGQLQSFERIAMGEGWSIPNGATIETRVRGVAYRELVEGEDLAIRLVAAWREPDAGGRYALLAERAAKILKSKSRA